MAIKKLATTQCAGMLAIPGELGPPHKYHSPPHMLSLFGSNSRKFKEIPSVYTHLSKRSSQATHIDIPLYKDKSKRADANTIEKIVYSDGSAHDSKVWCCSILKT